MQHVAAPRVGRWGRQWQHTHACAHAAHMLARRALGKKYLISRKAVAALVEPCSALLIMSLP